MINPVFASRINIPSWAVSNRRRYLASESLSACPGGACFVALIASVLLRIFFAGDSDSEAAALLARDFVLVVFNIGVAILPLRRAGRKSAVVIQLLFNKTLNGEIKLPLLLMLPAKTLCRFP